MTTALLIDQNLSIRLIDKLNPLFPVVKHVNNEGLATGLDVDVRAYAKKNEMIILTKDYDFRDLSIRYGCPPKVIHVTCGNSSTKYIIELLISSAAIIDMFINSESDCYLELF